MSSHVDVQTCPKCGGQGFVSVPPYVPGDIHAWTGSTTCSYSCPVCHGAKVIARAALADKEGGNMSDHADVPRFDGGIEVGGTTHKRPDHAAMSDAEHLARSVLAAKDAPGFALWKPWAMDLADAVIALVAERDAAQKALLALRSLMWRFAYPNNPDALVSGAAVAQWVSLIDAALAEGDTP